MDGNAGVIECRNLTRRFDGFAAVDDVSFAVAAGEVCALLGPNGSGKSTLVKLLAGLLPPTSGEVFLAGLDPANGRQRIPLRRVAGVLPEGLGLFDDLTIAEHLALTGDVFGLARRETATRTEELLTTLGLDEDRHTFAGQSSHGMRKKAALAVALLPNPEVLLLDEPFEGLDPVSGETVRWLLTTYAERGATVFLTSHTLGAVKEVAGHVLLIRAGRILHDSAADGMPGSLEETYFQMIERPKRDAMEWLGRAGS